VTRLFYAIAALAVGATVLLVLAAAEHHAAGRIRAAAPPLPVHVVSQDPAPVESGMTGSAQDVLRALTVPAPGDTAPLLRGVDVVAGAEGQERIVVTLQGEYGSVKRQTLRYIEAFKGYHLSELTLTREGAPSGRVVARLLLERARLEAEK
jgi:hypothetical protein